MDPNRQSANRVFRQPRVSELQPIYRVNEIRHKSSWFTNRYSIFFLSFILLSFLGGILLSLPIASNPGTFTNFDVALFTATSAITITGLAIVNTSTYWSPIGQAIIFTLMIVGGVSLVSVTAFLLVSIGHNYLLVQRGTSISPPGSSNSKLAYLTRNIIITTSIFYLLGTAAIFWNLHMSGNQDIGASIWQSSFLAVSAFNNAGFSIMQDIPTAGLYNGIVSGPFLALAVLLLIIVGGLGWPVLADLHQKRRINRLSLNTKLVLTTSLLLWIIGTLIFIFAEHSNTLTGLNFFDKLGHSLFHSISGRTSGFTTINFQSVQDFTKLTYSALMFIGGGSASMAGGIKINAFAVIIVAVISSLKGRFHPEAFGREVTGQQVSLALTLGFLGIAFIIIIMTILNVTEPHVNFLDLLFETISAFSTNGTSVGVVGTLSNIGNIILLSAMLLGRLGPIALALILIPRDNTAYNFIEERVTIG